MQLEGIKHLVLCGAKSPVSFFAYPGKASDLVPEGCEVLTLDPDALFEFGRTADIHLQPATRPDRPTGALTAATVAAALGALMPEGAIVSDEANTAGCTRRAPPPAARRTTGCASPAAPSAKDCRSPWAPRSHVRTAR